jgi:hypothetical protein
VPKKRQLLSYIVEVRQQVDPLDHEDMRAWSDFVKQLEETHGPENVSVKSTRMTRVAQGA